MPLPHWISAPSPAADARAQQCNLASWQSAADALASPLCPVWNRAWRLACDVGPSLSLFGPALDNGACARAAASDYESLFAAAPPREAPLVFVPTLALREFCDAVLPRIPPSRRFVLVTGLADWGPARCLGEGDAARGLDAAAALAADDRVVAWWAEMQDIFCGKVRGLPLGVDLHTLAFKQSERPAWGPTQTPAAQAAALARVVLRAPPRAHRDPRAFVFWGIRNRERVNITAALSSRAGDECVADFDGALPGSVERCEMWARMGAHAAVVCVAGYGVDCHRTWEALLLGCAVLVRDSPWARAALDGHRALFVDADGGARAWAGLDKGDVAGAVSPRGEEAAAERALESLLGDEAGVGGVRAAQLGALATAALDCGACGATQQRAAVAEEATRGDSSDEQLSAQQQLLLASTWIRAMRRSARTC